MVQVPKTSHLKSALRHVFMKISSEWPPQVWERADYTKAWMSVASCHSFTILLKHHAKILWNKATNSQDIPMANKLQELVDELEADSICQAIYANYSSPKKMAVFLDGEQSGPTKNSKFSEGFKVCLERAQKHRKEIDAIERDGAWHRRHAIYVGLEKIKTSELRRLDKKFLVETMEIASQGLECGELESHNFVVLERETNRICAPTNGKVQSFIFWTKSGPDDDTLTPEKIFGGIVYNASGFLQGRPDNSDQELSEESLYATAADEESCEYALLKKTILDRPRIITEGTLVKGGGIHSVYGALYQPKLPSILDDYEVLPDNKMNLGEAQMLIQAQNEAFLNGFLPTFAQRRLVSCSNRGKSSQPSGIAKIINICRTELYCISTCR
ncbi:hypothetical protein NLJ89_g10515 [Agrocybe chaxingu]|uniref:Uncharacterized protein n=1 Tax=Agrocybe chaxingu TaxID=84603 RepID=A0A9W8JY11_9AGAR|nr:hypothetical protein NLJ89_g10515 [Agrocybe chaxingu]